MSGTPGPRLDEALRPLIESLGFELVELKVVPTRGRAIVRIYLDRAGEEPGPGVTHGDCARVSREVSGFLEGEGLLGGSYVLEVSSPGLGRPLTAERHFRRNVGRLVELKAHDAEGHPYTVVGRLLGVEDGVIRLEVSGGEVHEVTLEMIGRARLVPEFRRSSGRSPGKRGA